MERNTLARATSLAREFLSLELPVTLTNLKKAFRAASRRFHPDAGGEEASKEKFIGAKEAFSVLAGFDGVPEVIMASENSNLAYGLLTIEGELLSTLGLGLGPLKNGKDCTNCRGSGYNSDTYQKYQNCTVCNGTGGKRTQRRCPMCRGKGRDGHHRCFACGGKGSQSDGFGNCLACFGSGRGKSENVQVYRKCSNCEGKGETECWNPVLPKGRLM